jgi:DNA-binding FadR family transcriptional regulator
MHRESATWRLVRTLGRDIVRGAYAADEAFPIEQTLSETHKLSRSVIREVVKILAAKGLIVSRTKIGIRVRPRSDWNWLDPDVLDWISASDLSPAFLAELLQLRRAVEPEAAALAASAGTPDQIDAIETAYMRMVAASQGLDDALESDVEFHTALLRASGNRLFAQLGRHVGTALRAGIRLTNRAAGDRVGNLADHHAILLAIRRGDPLAARQCAITLIDGAFVYVAHLSAEAV